MTGGTYPQLFVLGFDGRQFRATEVSHGCLPEELAQAVAAQCELEGDDLAFVLDAEDDDRQGRRRLVLGIPLSEQGVTDETRLYVGMEATAGVTLDLLLGFLGGSALVPFVQAISTKAGEDAYAKVRELLSRHVQRQPADDEDIVLIHHPSKVALRMPAEASRPSAPRGRDDADEGEGSSNGEWQVITWNPATGDWHQEACATPPANGIRVRRNWWRNTRGS
ncbi:hypothetical protein [Streptomyces sp. NPDC058086]|uniref:hypothetical protein n=1 Tax=Streptomyces sp. NPDC058086 TaxID=3346334 RepID=UPI0036E170C5